jgi:hypothetical protein
VRVSVQVAMTKYLGSKQLFLRALGPGVRRQALGSVSGGAACVSGRCLSVEQWRCLWCLLPGHLALATRAERDRVKCLLGGMMESTLPSSILRPDLAQVLY